MAILTESGMSANMMTENETLQSDSDNNEMKSSLLKCALHDVIETLTEREAMVLKLRFGLLDGHTHTLEEVGALFGVTRERIRQIENKALRKIRYHNCEDTPPKMESTTQDPDEILAQCVLDNGVALGDPMQFALCSVGLSEESDMSLITRGNHLLVSYRVNFFSTASPASLDFIHFNSNDAFELVYLSVSKQTMYAQINKTTSKINALHIDPLSINARSACLETELSAILLPACKSMANLALSALDQLLQVKCDGLSLKDFGYFNYK